MPEKINPQSENKDQQILRRLANIEHKIDSIEQTTAFTLRAQADIHDASIRSIFNGSLRRVQVYLAANGERSVKQISDHLGIKPPNVSRELSILQQEGLLEISELEGGKTYWCKKPLDRTIRISALLQKEFNVNKDGILNNKK